MVQVEVTQREQPDGGERFPRDKRGPNGEFQCQFCPEDDFENGVTRYRHEQTFHPQELKEFNSRKGAESPKNKNRPTSPEPAETPRHTAPPPRTIGGVRMDTVTEITRKFAGALEDGAPDMSPGKKKQLIISFDEHASQLNSNPGLLERFLNRAGLTTHQVEFIKLVMLGLNDGPGGGAGWGNPGWGPAGYNGSSPLAMTWDPRTGAMVPAPIFMMGGNNAPANSPVPPMFIMPGYGQQTESLSRRDVAEIVREAISESQESRGHRHRAGFT